MPRILNELQENGVAAMLVTRGSAVRRLINCIVPEKFMRITNTMAERERYW